MSIGISNRYGHRSSFGRGGANLFGDFWQDGLEAKKTYNVSITAAGRIRKI